MLESSLRNRLTSRSTRERNRGEARPVTISYDDAQSVEGLRKASARTGRLRIVTIEELDRSACGGTHVRSTAELGPIQIRGIEKIRGNIRLEYVAGQRALRRAKQDYRIGATLSRSAASRKSGRPSRAISRLSTRDRRKRKKSVADWRSNWRGFRARRFTRRQRPATGALNAHCCAPRRSTKFCVRSCRHFLLRARQ